MKLYSAHECTEAEIRALLRFGTTVRPAVSRPLPGSRRTWRGWLAFRLTRWAQALALVALRLQLQERLRI